MLRSPAFTLPAALLAATLLVPSTAVAQQADHTVVRGNTLWDLAEAVYGDARLWPRIWEANQDRVSDPHWIYPGQVLRIPGPGGEVREVVVRPMDPADSAAATPPGTPRQPPEGGRYAAPALGREGAGAPVGRLGAPNEPARAGIEQGVVAPLPVVSDDVIRGAPFLVPEGEEPPMVGRVLDFVDKPSGSAFHADLYEPLVLEATGGSFPPGAGLQAYRLSPAIPGLGRVATPTGVVLVRPREGEAILGEAVALYHALRLGDVLRPLPPAGPGPGVEPVRVPAGPEARIVGEAVPRTLQTVGDHVFLDVGRGTTSVGDEFVARASNAADGDHLGRLQIVHVQEGFATARILELVQPVFEPGLIVRMDRRMPAR